MIKKISSQTNKKIHQEKINNKSVLNNSKKISPDKTTKLKSNITKKEKREIFVRRSSGREEKFNTDRLVQTISRAGVPFLMAKDIAKSITKKIKKQIQRQSSEKEFINTLDSKTTNEESKKIIITASQIRNLIKEELYHRNKQEIALSYTGDLSKDKEIDIQDVKPSFDDKEPIIDKVAANKNKVLFDPSKNKGSC